jgi:hypothetical protein
MKAVTEKDIADLRREMQNYLAPVREQLDTHTDDINSLRTSVTEIPSAYAEILNLIDSSLPEWSKLAYTTLGVFPNTAGDTNLEAYNFFRQLSSDTLLAQSSANALKAAKTGEPADHTLWAANEAVDADIPRWDKVNGAVEFGGITNAYDLIIPIPNDVVFPGQIFYVQFEAMLRTSTALPTLQAFAGIYDNTAGQRKFIEGGSFTITDENGNDPGVTYGIPGATSVDYKIIAYTDSGEQAESNVLNFPNAPAVFDGNNHPRVKFSGVPGFIKWEIYRLKGGVYTLQQVIGNSLDGVFIDVGNPPVAVVDAFPTVTYTKPRAYAVTSTFAPGSLTGLAWARHALTIQIPTTYNRGVTGAGMQYFRLGLTGLTTDARQVLLRKFGLSMGSGKWARSANDVRPGAHSGPSVSAAGSGGGSGGGIDPPPPPGGGGTGSGCALIGTPLSLLSGEVAVEQAQRGDLTDNGGPVCGNILFVKQQHTGQIFWVETASGLRRGFTHTHPFISHRADYNGTPLSMLKARFDAGETVTTLTRPFRTVIEDRIVNITEEFGDFFVAIPEVEGSPVIILGGFLSHNNLAKP